MEYRSSPTSHHLLDHLSTIYPYLLLATLPLGVLLAFAIGAPSLAGEGLILLGPPVVGAFAVLYRHRSNAANLSRVVVHTNASTWQAAYLLALSTSIAVLALTPYRPWYYFGLVALLYVLVALQILGDTRGAAVVAQLAGIVLSWAYGLTLNYGLYFGGTSTLLHRFYADVTLASGSLIPADLSGYALFPLYHTFAAGVASLLGISPTLVLAAIVPIPYLVTIALVYSMVGGITADERVAQLTALLFAAHPIVLYYAPYMITRTMSFVGFVALLWIAYSRHRFSRGQYLFLLSVVVGFVTLVHHVSAPQILSLLLVLAVSERVLTDHRFATPPLLALGLATVIYWGTIGSQFARTIAATFLNPEQYASSDVAGSAADTVPHLTYYAHSYLLIGLVLVGIGVLLVSYRDRYEVVFGVFALATLVLAVPSPIHALGPTSDLLRMDRYMLLLSPFVAFASAVGVYGLANALRSRTGSSRRTLRVAVVVVLVVSLALTSVTAASTAPNAADAEELDWTGPPVHFTDDELRGLEFVPTNVPEGSSVAGDWQTARFYRPNAYDFEGSEELGVPIYDRQVIGTVDDVYGYEGHLLVRTERLERGQVLLGGEGKGERAGFDDESSMTAAIGDGDVVYANDEVTIYRVEERDPPGGPDS